MAKDFIDTNDFTVAELTAMVDLIGLKEADRDGCVPPLLHRRSLGMIFEESSTRTKVRSRWPWPSSAAMRCTCGRGRFTWVPGSRSGIPRVLSRMCDVIEARVLKHQTMTDLAAAASVPVINGAVRLQPPHPGACGLFTMTEHQVLDRAHDQGRGDDDPVTERTGDALSEEGDLRRRTCLAVLRP